MLSLLCYAVSQATCINKYFENDLLFLLSSRWFSVNKPVINTEKTNAISFHAWQNKSIIKPKISFQNMDIKYKNETKFLGKTPKKKPQTKNQNQGCKMGSAHKTCMQYVKQELLCTSIT